MSVNGWQRWWQSRTRPRHSPRRPAAFLNGPPDAWRLEERRLLSTAPVTFPRPSVDKVEKVLYNGVTGSFQKTITITNNSPTQTVYAFLEGQDSRQAVSPYEGTGAFDPFDPSNQEYRAYVGYTDGTQNFAGIPPRSSITITVPLVFWDSGRIIFSTDGAHQFATYGGSGGGSPAGAPFYYHDTNTQATFFAAIDPNQTNQLRFTPAYNSFDPLDGYKPSTSQWKSPVEAGTLPDGQTFIVTGPGLPAAGSLVTIDASHPGYVTLPAAGVTQNDPVQQYVFTSTSPAGFSPTARVIEGGYTLTTAGGTTTQNGLVMWYHALTPQSPNNDAPFQLTEVTFRGTFYSATANPTTGFKYLLGDAIEGADTDSADYDISFVDTINLPVAMEASNVSIPNTGLQAPFGWVGSSQTLEEFQAALAAVTSPNPKGGGNLNGLGSYFGGQGYPAYLSVDPGNIKLPSGQNLFFASPALGGAADIQFYKKFTDGSVINQPLFALTSGGTGPTTLVIGGDPSHKSVGNLLGLNTAALANQYALNQLIAPNLSDGFSYDVTYNLNGTNLLAGKVVGLYRDANQQIIGVQLDRPVPPNAATQVYSFTLPKHDYAAGGIAGLWYSWAKYYADHVKSTAASNLAGTLSANLLTLSAPAAGLVAGMSVTGPGVPAGCVVLSVSADQWTVQLSAVPGAKAGPFSFAAPAFGALVGFDNTPGGNTPLVNLAFTPPQQAYALAFAQTVYVVMSSWGVSVPAGTPNGWNPLLLNIIGGNLGPNYLPAANVDVVNALTNLSKSALRGVPDFTSPLYSNPAQWYPDPALPAGGLSYNAYNLNPFVWYIHEKLGLTAYAFALDDDVGNVNGGGANHIDIAIGGLNGLPNKDPYTPTSPWGVVTTLATAPQPGSSLLQAMTNPKVVYQIAPFDYNQNTPGTLVNGPGVPMGTGAQFTLIAPNLGQSQLQLSQPLAVAPSGASYAFFGPLVFTATVLGKGQPANTLILDSPDAYNTLVKLGPLQNVEVTGEGIDPSDTVTVQGLTRDPNTGVITVALSKNLNRNQVSQPGGFYAYTFGSLNVPVVRDPGFEWGIVQGLVGKFNHGDQLTQNTVDWTFTDSPTNPKNWFAGIAYRNQSVYTQLNPVPPQGLQVGFVQGDSSLSQRLTLGKGTYSLNFYAAQRETNQAPQTLRILVDGNPVGTVTPNGPNYALVGVRFTVAAGKHTITFQGTQASDSTALIDSVVCNAAPSLAQVVRQRQPTTVVYLTEPVGGTAGSALAPVRVAVLDQYGVRLNGVTVRLSLIRPPGVTTGRFAVGSVLQATTVNGVATFNRLTLRGRGVYAFRASVGLLRTNSRAFVVKAALPPPPLPGPSR